MQEKLPRGSNLTECEKMRWAKWKGQLLGGSESQARKQAVWVALRLKSEGCVPLEICLPGGGCSGKLQREVLLQRGGWLHPCRPGQCTSARGVGRRFSQRAGGGRAQSPTLGSRVSSAHPNLRLRTGTWILEASQIYK